MSASQRGLSPAARRLLAISGLFALSVGLSGTFVNVYLWKVDRAFAAIGWFNLLNYLLMPVGFWWAARMAARHGGTWTLCGGLAGHAAFYALTLFGGTRVAHHAALLGVILGLAGGWYWYSYNVLSLALTDADTRARFFGWNGTLGAVAGMVAPPVAGFLISGLDRWGGLGGYHWVFGLSLLLFLAAGWVSAGIPAQPLGPVNLRRALSSLRRPRWRLLLVACATYGLREGVFLFLIAILFYIQAGSEWRLGAFTFVQSVLSSISFYGVGRMVRPDNRRTVQWLGALCMAAAALLFTLPLRASSLFVYGVVIAVSLPMFLIPLQSLVFDSIVHIGSADESGAAFVVREAFANLGRVAGIALFLAVLVTSGTAGIPRLALGLGMVQLMVCGLLTAGRVGDGIARTWRRKVASEA